MLASSPSFFAATPLKPLPRDTSRVSAPFTMTNAGLHIRLYLKAVNPVSEADDNSDGTSQEYYGVLGCASYIASDGEYHSAAILLTSLGGDQYARVSPETIVSLPSNLLANPQQGYGYQYIYVKQLPTYGLPDIALDSSVFEPGSLPTLQIPIRLLDVYPLDNWNEPTFTLKPTMTLQNTVLGAFRYALVHHNGKLGDSVDIFVGIAPGYEGPRLLWCAQQQTDRNRALTESATDFDSSKITKKMRTIPQDQHPLLHVLAKVQTIRVQNRTKIHLSLSEIHETAGGAVSTGGFPTAGLAEIDSGIVPNIPAEKPNILTEKPTIASLGDAEPFVLEESWDIGLGFSMFESGQAKLQTRIRAPPQRARLKDIQIGYLPLRHLVASMEQPVEIRLEQDLSLAHGDDGAHFQQYFSLLLAQACVRNDVDAAAELLRSPLSNAMVEVQTCLQSKHEEPPPWHSAFRRFRPIHWAVVFGHRELLGILLAHGADVLSTTGICLSVIHLAIIMGRMELIQDLIEAIPENWEDKRPDWFEKTDVREPIAHLAASYVTSNAITGILARFMRATDSFGAIYCTNALHNALHETPLHRAAANGNLVAVKAILALALISDIDPMDHHDRTPLWHAAAAGAHDIVKLFLQDLADPNKHDDKGWTPLHAACRGGHARVVGLLLEAGVDVSEPERRPSFSAWHLAVLSGNADTLRILLDHGQDTDEALSCSNRHFLPIHIAVSNGWLDCVQFFYEAGCITWLPGQRFIDTLIVESQGSGTVSLHVAVGGTKPSLGDLASLYGHTEVLNYFERMKLRR